MHALVLRLFFAQLPHYAITDKPDTGALLIFLYVFISVQCAWVCTTQTRI